MSFCQALSLKLLCWNNVRIQLQKLNDVSFSDHEWQRFVINYLDKPSDSITDKARKIHEDHIHDFVFDDGLIKNIYLLDKKNLARNKVQVLKQFEQKGKHLNRYDVTILVNDLPLVQIELKNVALLFVRHLIKFIVTARKALIVIIHYLNSCKYL